MIRVVHPGSGSCFFLPLPDPGVIRHRIPDPDPQHSAGEGAKNWFLSSRKYDPGCSSWSRILFCFTHPGSNRILDPDPQQHCTGPVYMQVKVLGTLAMVDDGEADWKMIVIGGIVRLKLEGRIFNFNINTLCFFM
jgi:hypothetical protein